MGYWYNLVVALVLKRDQSNVATTWWRPTSSYCRCGIDSSSAGTVRYQTFLPVEGMQDLHSTCHFYRVQAFHGYDSTRLDTTISLKNCLLLVQVGSNACKNPAYPVKEENISFGTTWKQRLCHELRMNRYTSHVRSPELYQLRFPLACLNRYKAQIGRYWLTKCVWPVPLYNVVIPH